MHFTRFNPESLTPAKAVEKVNVVILYDRLADISKASATYLQLTHDLGDDYSPDFHLWRVDLTVEAGFCDEAERDLADADVVIVAVNGHEKCPTEYQRWKAGAGHEGGRAPHAIFALVEGGDEAEPAPGTWSGLLHHVATPINSEIFVSELSGQA
ncbi:MAG TPA: hypothetical protein VG734_01160 [Lacunisphaera sp.]|nr:hypothetical protein [Lacunisphaera sp.]